MICGFESIRGMPNVTGAINCTHVKIIKPANTRAKPYYDREHNYSLVVQAVVDHRGKFIDVYLGWPGSVHDARVFSNSPMLHQMEANTFLEASLAEVDGELIWPYIIQFIPS